MRSLLCVFLLLLFAACKNRKSPLMTDNLPSWTVQIRAGYDTTIRTPKGAYLKIPANAFTADVELEVKEAYTMKDILLAGLRTETNGQPLNSGGMIYINRKDKKDVRLGAPITVLLPTNSIEPGMTVYKGEEKEDSINWLPADTLQPNVMNDLIAAGKNIFVNNCASCHAINKNLSGPALNGVWSRGPWAENLNYLAAWVHNPARFIPRSSYTRDLQKQYGQIMPGFPALGDEGVMAVLAFVKNESTKALTDTFVIPRSLSGALGTPTDSSSDVTQLIKEENENPCFDTLYGKQTIDTAVISEDYADLLLENADTSTDSELLDPNSLLGLRNGFTDALISDGTYKFQIKTLGWYNVDVAVKGLPNTVLCELLVQVIAPTAVQWNVYAFFPKQQNLSVGMQQTETDFAFRKVENKIPLYLSEPGTIVVFGNRGDDFYYGTKTFRVQSSQSLKVDVKRSSEEAFLKAIRDQQLEGINLDVIRQERIIKPCNDFAVPDTVTSVETN